MERKEFLKRLGLGALLVPLAAACKLKDSDNTYISCSNFREEVEGPYPYPAGEALNPLNRSDITGGQVGIPLSLQIKVVNFSNGCGSIPGARVHIWHCNRDGYYSGYANQDGVNGIQDFTGQNWLRGFQVTDANAVVNFKTIYPGWETGRATHIHVEVFIDGVLKKTGQFAFPERANDLVNVSPKYVNHGANPTKNSADPAFGEDSAALASETLLLDGSVDSGFTASYLIGIPL
jgi:protocatechuate 3,4-dioxygenase beta subunit